MDQEAAFFKVLSEPIRLRLMILLAIEGRTCVCQLAEALDEPEYKVSPTSGDYSVGWFGADRTAGDVDFL